MKVIIVGLGIQGKKRAAVAGENVIATVDPIHPEADYKDVREVNLNHYDAALVCTPDNAKIEILKFLLQNKKHVLVEKPLLSFREGDLEHLGLLSKQQKVALYTAYNHRFEPFLTQVKSIIDKNILGTTYSLSMYYGNGTARDVRNSPWRDKGIGVLSDLGSHLLDTTDFLLSASKRDFSSFELNCFENKAYDHVSFGTKIGVPRIHLEATLLSWKNTFRLDILAEKGSVHVNGLCKWGPSTLSIRTRVLPSGRPKEETETLECLDPTWEEEYKFFEKACRAAHTNIETDIWINKTLDFLSGNQALKNQEFKRN